MVTSIPSPHHCPITSSMNVDIAAWKLQKKARSREAKLNLANGRWLQPCNRMMDMSGRNEFRFGIYRRRSLCISRLSILAVPAHLRCDELPGVRSLTR